MASSSFAEPVVVLYKSSACRHCTSLANIWDKPPSKDQDSVMSALKKVYPNIRFYVVTAKDNTGKFDENTAPKDLIRYAKWFPNVILIPGRLWDSAMSKLGPKNDVLLIDGVQIMNGKLVNGSPTYEQTYNITKPADFATWLKASLEKEDFKEIQNKPTSPPPVPIQPLLSNIVRPSASTIETRAASNNSDVCSMRIISRPK